MNSESPQRPIIFRSYQRHAAMELRLVLEAAGIPNAITSNAGEWFLSVDDADEPIALAELAAYRRDNPLKPAEKKSRIPVFGGTVIGAFLYGAVIVSIGAISGAENSRPLWNSIGRMRSGDVLSGEIWRTITALTLHADAEHLFSNLAFGCVFGLMVGRILGGGIAWLTILLAGATGNFLNAIMRDADHSSIGASTAVFAAIGVLVAHALHPRFVTQERLLKRWSPLIAGMLLLAFIGVGGERTDVGAHVTGFFAGIVLGWLAARLPQQWMSSSRVQWFAGAVAALLLCAAWGIAVAGATM